MKTIFLEITWKQMDFSKLAQILENVDSQILQQVADIYCVKELWQPPKNNAKKSAVLTLLTPEQKVILIKRTKDNSPHSKQIALPGGRKESLDFSLKHTAIREAKEEIGLNPKNIKLLGKLNPVYVPVSNFWIYPFVAFLKQNQQFIVNPAEVEKILFFPIKQLKNYNFPIFKETEVRGKIITVPGFLYGEIFVWGATAKILSQLGYIVSQFDKL